MEHISLVCMHLITSYAALPQTYYRGMYIQCNYDIEEVFMLFRTASYLKVVFGFVADEVIKKLPDRNFSIRKISSITHT